MTQKNSTTRNVKKIGLGIIFVAVLIGMIVLQRGGYIDIESFGDYIREKGYIGWLLFIAVYILGTVFAFPGAILTLTAGYIFKASTGFFVVVIGASIGALFSFLIARYLFHDYFQNKFGNSRFLKWMKTEDQKKLTSGVFFMRLLPIFPFNALNYGIGLSKIKARNYFLATLFGIMPGTFVYVFLGSSLNDIFSAKFIIALIVLIVFSLIVGRIAKRTKFKNSGKVEIPLNDHGIQVEGTHVGMN